MRLHPSVGLDYLFWKRGSGKDLRYQRIGIQRDKAPPIAEAVREFSLRIPGLVLPEVVLAGLAPTSSIVARR